MVEISERVLRLAKEGGWIGVDLDGTLFTYTEWVKWDTFGEPIEPMVDRIRAWHTAGVEVRIVTARVGLPETVMGGNWIVSRKLVSKCKVSGEMFSDMKMVAAIQNHLEKHHLPRLKVQCYKDVDMIELWDDRAVQVVPNMGITLAEEQDAIYEAEHGAQFGEPLATGPAPISTEGVDFEMPTCCGDREIMAARHMATHFSDVLQLTSLCHRSLVPAFEDSVASMAVVIALLQVPAVEAGTEEARYETERVLTGMEARVIARVREYQRQLIEGQMAQAKDEARSSGQKVGQH